MTEDKITNQDDERLKQNRLIFYSQDVKDLKNVLIVFLKRTKAKCAILIDKEGHLITMHGDTDSYDMDTICALLATTFAATQEWAKLLGEKEFSVLFHQGKKDSIQVTLIEDRALLAVIFDHRTQLGLVRLVCNEASKKIAKLFQGAGKRKSQEEEQMDFTLQNIGQIDDMFDDLFKE